MEEYEAHSINNNPGQAISDEELEDLFGPLAPYADHCRGETIRFRTAAGAIVTSTIVWIKAARSSYEGGKLRPVTYIMADLDELSGMPYMVYPSEILEQ